MDDTKDVASSLSSVPVPLTGLLIGAVAGAILALLINSLVVWGSKKDAVFRQLSRRSRIPSALFLTTLGAWIGFVFSAPADPPVWHQHVAHGLVVLTIMWGGCTVYLGLNVLTDKEVLSDVRSGRDIRRFRTQAEILRKFSQVLTVFLTSMLILLTFPGARAPIASVLASAGLLSVVAGLAAQTTLGNVFAGLQLAFTDALRVGDNVVAPGEEQPGRVEEITLTYVVVRIWDERRVILPSSVFTTEGFENWTRKSASQLAAFDIEVDWTAPVAEIRAEIKRLLDGTDLWDGRTWSLQVFDLPGAYMTLRITISGSNWARLQDLRAYLRENLVAWIRENTPWAIPRERFIAAEGVKVEPAMGTDAFDKTLISPPETTGPFGGGEYTKEELAKPDPDAEIKAEVRHAQDASGGEGGKKHHGHGKKKKHKKKEKGVDGSRLFSGSHDGDHRAALYDGPGDTTWRNRILRTIQRNKDEEAIPLQGSFDKDVLQQAENPPPADQVEAHPHSPGQDLQISPDSETDPAVRYVDPAAAQAPGYEELAADDGESQAPSALPSNGSTVKRTKWEGDKKQ